MVSSCGKTVMHKQPYISRFEDEYGNVQEKELSHPTVEHMLYEFLPLIDEHNKAHQSALALEKCWLTKNCWFRIMTTFIGMSVVDVQRWDRRRWYGHVGTIQQIGFNEVHKNFIDYFDIKTMANLIGKPLADGCFSYQRCAQPSNRITSLADANAKLFVCITGPDGTVNYPVTEPGQYLRVHEQTC